MTEYMQPNRPMRIHTRGEDKYDFVHPVFAIAIANDNDIEYLTINGRFYSSDKILFTETLIDGEWVALHTEGRLTGL